MTFENGDYTKKSMLTIDLGKPKNKVAIVIGVVILAAVILIIIF